MTIDELVTLLQARLPGAEVFARDLTGGGNHFEAVIVHNSFAGRSRVDRQRMAMAALANEWSVLHALTMKTYTPEEWEKI